MIVFFSALFIVIFSVAPYAKDMESGSVMSSGDRTVALQALQAIKKGRWNRAENLMAETRDPLAAKIYNWFSYTKNKGNISFKRVTGFVKQNPDWPQRGKMRLTAEKSMTATLDDHDVIDWFDHYPPLTPEGMEHFLDALQRQGFHKKMQDVARDWWSYTLLTPAQQNKFLGKYGRFIDRNTHHVRFDTLLFKEHFTNARVIARLLGRGYPALAEARIALASDGYALDRKIAAVPQNLMNDSGLSYERLRWRRRHNKTYGALEILHNPPQAEKITNLPDWWSERHIMARRFMETGQYESAYLLVNKHQQKQGFAFAQAEFLAGWLALQFMDEPWRAFEHFETLYLRTSTPISRARGAYWAGRASINLGHADIARKWFRAAARYQTTYYGQLALASLDDDYKPPQQMPPQRSLETQNAFNRLEMVQVVRLLHKTGLRKETSGFLDALARKVEKPEDYILVADLAEETNHYQNAVRVAKKGIRKNIFMMEHSYPTILAKLKNITLEWALVHALIRQESAFDYAAKSPAGAQGLMQIMPATARDVARQKGWAYRTSWLTSRPDYNIKLGASYMEKMLARFDNSYPLAIAAYNGGPGRVNRWLKQFGDPRKGEDIDIIDWVELIPVYETRNYVQRVLEGVYVYRLKLRDVQGHAQAPIHVALRNSKS